MTSQEEEEVFIENGIMDEEQQQQQDQTHAAYRQKVRVGSNYNNAAMHRRRATLETSSRVETDRPPRLILRDLPHHQSANRVAIVNRHQSDVYYYLFARDWFHRFLRLPTSVSILILIAIWTGAIVVWAAIYFGFDRIDPEQQCGLGAAGDPIHFGASFAFSLETCTTVGYGLPNSVNSFFDECPELQVIIYFQMLWSMLFNALLLSFFFARIARSETRAVQVLFSKKAIIKKQNNKWIFQIRVYDTDSAHPVVEAHIRLYALSPRSNRELHTMRLLRPNDDLGGVLFTSIPTTIKHHVDAYSPLSYELLNPGENGEVIEGNGLILREVDSYTGNRDGYVCPVCGETYGTYERLTKHVKFQKLVEEHDDYPVEGSHREVKIESIKEHIIKESEIRDCLKEMEIICVVEGIEPLVSGTFQALHSYTIDDIEFGSCSFAPCVSYHEQHIPEKKKKRVVVDLDDFHKVIRSPQGQPLADARVLQQSYEVGLEEKMK